MEGYPLTGYDNLSGYDNMTSSYNESLCSPETIMDSIAHVPHKPWESLITMKEELINHMKDENISHDVPFSKIDELSNSLIDFMKDFNEYKKSMDEAEKLMKVAIESNQKDIQVIETFIQFLSKISNQTDKDIEPIQSQIKAVCEDIKQNNTMKEAKDNYIKEKIKFHKHLNIIKLMNQMNVGSTCSICLQDNVDSYFNPCGHTACTKCIRKNAEYERPCPLCRKQVHSIHKLFFT